MVTYYINASDVEDNVPSDYLIASPGSLRGYLVDFICK